MIKDNQRYFNRLHLLIDGVVAGLAYMLAWFIKFRSGIIEIEAGTGYHSMATYFSALYFIVPGYVFLYYIFHLYTPKRAAGRKIEFYNIVKANTVGFVLFIGILYVIRQREFSSGMIFMFYGLNIVLET